MSERRRYERFPARFWLDVSRDPLKTDPKRGVAKDLSRGGAKFLMTDPVGVGENVKLRIVTDQNGEKLVDATVVREEGVVQDGAQRYEIAVEFESILPEKVMAHLKNGKNHSDDENEDEQERDDGEKNEAADSEAAKVS